jgi:hypothetical protein
MTTTTLAASTALVHKRTSNAIYATKPTALTRWLRVSLLWQVIRFVVINLRMLRIIARSHRSRP